MKKIILSGEPMGLLIARQQGRLEDVDQFQLAVAGAEINVAVGLSRLEHAVSYLTKLGDDLYGKKVMHLLKENHIDTSLVSISDSRPTGYMFKSCTSQGDPDIFYCRKNSAASTINEEDIDRIPMENYGVIHVTGIFPALSETTFRATKKMIRRGKELGMPVFFDPNLRPQLWGTTERMVKCINELAAEADYVLPGIAEGKILTGFDTPEEIAAFYHGLGIPNVVVKCGAKGAFISEKAEDGFKQVMVPGFSVTVVDTVGAGDGFAAGVISGINEGLSLPEAVKRGNALGAFQVQSVGDNEGLPTRQQLEAFLKERE